jgi:hypothetical protein
LNVFLPGSAVVAYVRDVLADLTVTETGNSLTLCYPFRRSKLRQRFVQTPDEEICYLFGLLRTAPPNDLTAVDAQVAANRALFEQAWALGGTHYPIGALPCSPADWRHHFGADWPHFLRLKAHYDPRQVLTPGHGIFPA